MTDSAELAEYFGFTGDETESLCAQYHMSFEETKAWYDGYQFTSNSSDRSEPLRIQPIKSLRDGAGCLLPVRFRTVCAVNAQTYLNCYVYDI